MKLLKSIILTVLFYVTIEVIGLWILLIPLETNEYLDLLKGSHFISSIVALVILLSVFKLIKRTDLLKPKKTDFKFYIIAAILGVGFVFFQSILNIIYYQEFSYKRFDFEFTLERLNSLNTLATILIVPITEELFFRNYLQGGLVRCYTPVKALIYTSLLFAFIHIPFASLFYEFMDFNLHQPFVAIFGGLISGMLFYKSKSITPSIIFHIMWNLTVNVV